jgi:hypothetical protein
VPEDDHPVVAQLIGADPDEVARAAVAMTDAGFDAIDINLGCPVRKILGRRRGGFLLSEPDAALAIVRSVFTAVGSMYPVTVKMRRGTDDSPEAASRVFRILDGVFEIGVSAVTMHPRTVKQRYVGPSDWSFLTRVKEHVGDRQRDRGDTGFAEEDFGERFVLQPPDLATRDIRDTRDRLLGKQMYEADVRPAEQDVPFGTDACLVVFIHLLKHMVYFIIAVEQKGDFQCQYVGENGGDALTRKSRSLELADPHLPQDHGIVALYSSGIDLQPHCSGRFLTERAVNPADSFHPVTPVRSKAGYLQQVLRLPRGCPDRESCPNKDQEGCGKPDTSGGVRRIHPSPSTVFGPDGALRRSAT